MRVLLVEDDDGIRTLATMALERVGGMDVTSAIHGENALELAPGGEFDVFVIDMMMPGMDGMATMARLREMGLTTPVIFLTARVQAGEVATYKAAGALGTIKKPFDPMTLADDVRSVLAGRNA